MRVRREKTGETGSRGRDSAVPGRFVEVGGGFVEIREKCAPGHQTPVGGRLTLRATPRTRKGRDAGIPLWEIDLRARGC